MQSYTIRVVCLSSTAHQAGRLDPGGALDHGALATFAADDGPFAAHGAPVIGVAVIGADEPPDHGARVDGCAELMFFVLAEIEDFG